MRARRKRGGDDPSRRHRWVSSFSQSNRKRKEGWGWREESKGRSSISTKKKFGVVPKRQTTMHTHTHTHWRIVSQTGKNKDQTHKDETRGYHCIESGKKIIKSNRYSGQWQLWRFWLLQKDGGRCLCCCLSYFLYYSLETFLQSKRRIYQSLWDTLCLR